MMINVAEDALTQEWEALPIETWKGAIMLLGGVDAGKKTLAQYIYDRLQTVGTPTAYLDTDLGQNLFAPPATIGLSVPAIETSGEITGMAATYHYFVGSNSPRYNRLRLLLGMSLMRSIAARHGCKAMVVNTSGFIDRKHGGYTLKWAKIELLRNCRVVAIQREDELEQILEPLRNMPSIDLHVVSAPHEGDTRPQDERKQARAASYQMHFEGARRIPLSINSMAVFPKRSFTPGQICALEDPNGLTLSLAVIEEYRRESGVLWVYSPIENSSAACAVRLGNLVLDLETYMDGPLHFHKSKD